MLIDLGVLKPKWHRFPENAGDADEFCELQIRMYPDSKKNAILRQGADGKPEMLFRGTDRQEAFVHCLVGVKGLFDAEGHEISKMSDQFKRDLFDAESAIKTGVPEFVLEKAGAITNLLEARTKNS